MAGSTQQLVVGSLGRRGGRARATAARRIFLACGGLRGQCDQPRRALAAALQSCSCRLPIAARAGMFQGLHGNATLPMVMCLCFALLLIQLLLLLLLLMLLHTSAATPL